MIEPYWKNESICIYNCDCADILSAIGEFDLLLTDPPYGISYEASRYRNSLHAGVIHGDDTEFNPSQLLSCNFKNKIIWGGNNFSDKLPKGGWLCWDKRCCESADRIHGSPFELAWVSDESKFKMKRLQHAAAVNADKSGKRLHPTQKPIALMEWCMLMFRTVSSVIDPYMGSGTTLVAAKKLGIKAVGIEISRKYCDIAIGRLSQSYLEFE